MTTPADRIRERNQQIVDTVQPYAEELRESLEESGLGAAHLPARGEVAATEYAQAYRDSPLSLDDSTDDVKELETANVDDYIAAVGRSAAAYTDVETAASLYARDDTTPVDAIDADWSLIDRAYSDEAPEDGIKADCTELPFQDDSLDLVLLKAPGGAFIPDSRTVLDETYRVLSDDGVLAASDAYVDEPDGFEELEPVTPEPAVYHSRLDQQDGEIRNLEGRIRLYRPE